MARFPRIPVPGIARHVTHRGNRCQQVFIQEDNCTLYRDLLAHHCKFNGIEVWSYCLNPGVTHKPSRDNVDRD